MHQHRSISKSILYGLITLFAFINLATAADIDFDTIYRGQGVDLEADINSAFTSATDGDTIVFNSDVTFLLTAQISTTKAINLRGTNGVNVIFDGQNQTRLLNYNFDGRLNALTSNNHYDIRIENISFQNGNTVEHFEKITVNPDNSINRDDNSGNYYTINDYLIDSLAEQSKYYASSTTYTDVVHNGAGGALYIYGANIILESVTIKNNLALSYGGGLYTRYGNTTINNSTIQNNIASQIATQPYAYGGGAYISAIDQTGNSSSTNWNLLETYTNNIIKSNIARAAALNASGYGVGRVKGGGIYTYTGTNNSSYSKTFSSNDFTNNGAYCYNDSSYGSGYIEGGALYISGGITNLSDNLVSGTTIETITNSTILASGYSSGAYTRGSGAYLYATNVTFFQNQVYGNTASSHSISSNSNDTSQSYGGGIYYTPQGTISESTFKDNDIYSNTTYSNSGSLSESAGGGIYSRIGGGGNGILKIENNFIRLNTVTSTGQTINVRSYGAGIYSDNFANPSETYYTRNSISNNITFSNGTESSKSFGGGVYSSGAFGSSAIINFTSNTIAGNQQISSNSNGGSESCSGSGIYLGNNTDLEIYYNTIVGNTQSGSYRVGSGFYNSQYNNDINSQVIHGNIIAFNQTGTNQYHSGGYIETGANNLMGVTSGYPGLTGDLASSNYGDIFQLGLNVIYGSDGVSPLHYTLDSTSDLIDSGALPNNPAIELRTDQLGKPIHGANRDIGSIEVSPQGPFQVDFSTGANGSLTGTLSQLIDYGEINDPVNAYPDSGYYFHSWSVDNGFSYDWNSDTALATDTPLIIPNISNDLAFTANFLLDVDYTVSANATTGGSVDVTSQSVQNGQDASAITATRNSGYKFIGWTGDITSNDNPLILSSINTNTSVTANFQLATYAVNFISNGNGTISGTSSQNVDILTETSEITAVPTVGYDFSHWTISAGDLNNYLLNSIATDATIKTLGIDQNLSFNANFIKAPVRTYPYSESFESGLGPWEQESGDNGDWTRKSGSTQSSSTGPSSAADGTYYMYVESSSPNYPSKIFYLSANFDFSTLTNPLITFKSHMYGAAMGTLSLQASTDNVNWTDIWTKSGDQGNNWTNEEVNLNAYSGLPNVYLRFNGLTDNSYTSDMSIDDISIFDAVNTAPVVDLGNNRSITLPNNLSITSSVTDDGLPSNSLTYTWSKISGPGLTTPADASSKDTNFSFSAEGTYVLRLTADDGELSHSDDIVVTVYLGPNINNGKYEISNLNELKWLSENPSYWSSDFIITANIDATATASWNNGEGFSPIGNSSINFSGSFTNENQYIISNLFINRPNEDHVGFFGQLGNATLDNIILNDVSITGGNRVGGLVGHINNFSATISNISITGLVNGQTDVGGITGYNNGNISNSVSAADVTGTSNVGGVAGLNLSIPFDGGGTVSESISSGITSGVSNVGGIVGDNKGSFSDGTITSCIAYGDVIQNGIQESTYVGDSYTNYLIQSVYFKINSLSNISYSTLDISVVADKEGSSGSAYDKVGLAWSTSPSPTIFNDTSEKFESAFSTHSFSLSSLTPNTLYYLRPYLKLAGGEVIYGHEVTFSTNEIPSYSVSFSPSINGDLSGTTSQNIIQASGSSAVTANPAGGYYFHSWTVDNGFTYNWDSDTALATDNPLIIPNVTDDLAFTANFLQDINFNVNANATSGGSVDLSSQSIQNGQGANAITATADFGYEFTGWTGDLSSSNNPLSISNVSNNINVTAHFQKLAQYTVTFDLGIGATHTGGGDLNQNIYHGYTAIAPNIHVNSGFIFSGWDMDFSSITTNLTIKAIYTLHAEKYTASDGSVGDYFGNSVSVNGYFALIGANGDYINGPSTGSAYIIDLRTGQEIYKLVANDGANGDYFGTSVSLHGNYAIIGAPGDDDNGSSSGSAYVFDLNTGQEIYKLLPNDGAADDHFGQAVSVHGNYATIGAYGDDDNNQSSGSAYVFDLTTGQQIHKLLPSDGANSDYFGNKISTYGNYSVISAELDDDNDLSSGSAYVFDLTTGQQIHKLLPNDGARFDYFGASVGIYGDHIIIGSPGDDDNDLSSGSAYLFNLNTGQQIAKLTANDGINGGYFGYSVALNNNFALIGAPGDSDQGPNTGSAYLFDLNTGKQIYKLYDKDGKAENDFGQSVSINETSILIGSKRDDINDTYVNYDDGSALLYSVPLLNNETYLLSLSNGTGGGTFAENVLINIIADTAPTEQIFSHWTSSNGGSFDDVDSASTTFTMPANDTTLTANYSTITYTVTFDLGDYGTSLDSLSQSVAHGANASAPNVTPNTAYSFTGWSSTFSNVSSDLTITAQYSLNAYDVTFNSGEGLQSNVVQVNYGAAASAPNPAELDGKTFSHWDVDFSNITSDLTVTAVYTANQYTVTFNLGNHGSSSDALVQNIDHGSSAVAPNITPNTGQSFSGWDIAFNNVTSNLTVTAIYNVISYTVIFDLGDHGSSLDNLTQSVAHGANASAPNVTPNTAYSFTGWDTTFSNVSSNLTITAQYSLIAYDVTFNSGEGMQSNVVQVNYGAAASAPNPAELDGKTFSHWDVDFSNITSDLTVTAVYTVNQYTVTFNLGNHGSSSDALVQNIDHGSSAVAPNITPNTGQSFSGWDIAFNNVTSNLTVTAIYNVISYTVIFDLGDHGTSLDSLSQSIAHGANASAPSVTPNTAYSFTGWDTTFSNVSSDLTITAQYSLNAYDVTFNSGEGLQSNVVQVNYGAAASAPNPAELDGKTFSHWDVDFSNITSDLTVTAVYTVNQYTVIFNLGNHGSSLDALVQNIDHGSSAVAPNITPNAGQRFSGWDIAFNNVTSDLTVTAIYNTIAYTVTFDINGGSHKGGGNLTQEVIHGQAAHAPLLQAPEGYTLRQWSRTFNEVTSSFTVEAQFELISNFTFTVTFDPGEQGSASSKSLIQSLTYGQTPKEPKVKAALGYEFLGWDKEIAPVTQSITYSARYADLTEDVRNLSQYDIEFLGTEIYDLTDSLQEIHTAISIDGQGKINSVHEESSGDDFLAATFKGKISTKKTGLNVQINYKEKNFIDGIKGKSSYKIGLDLVDDQLVGYKKINSETLPVSYPLVNTDGTYELDLSSLVMDTKGKYLGDVQLHLSSGRSYALTAKGKLNVKKGLISLKLKGIKGQPSTGISLNITINTDNIITTIKGKALGQKVLYLNE